MAIQGFCSCAVNCPGLLDLGSAVLLPVYSTTINALEQVFQASARPRRWPPVLLICLLQNYFFTNLIASSRCACRPISAPGTAHRNQQADNCPFSTMERTQGRPTQLASTQTRLHFAMEPCSPNLCVLPAERKKWGLEWHNDWKPEDLSFKFKTLEQPDSSQVWCEVVILSRCPHWELLMLLEPKQMWRQYTHWILLWSVHSCIKQGRGNLVFSGCMRSFFLFQALPPPDLIKLTPNSGAYLRGKHLQRERCEVYLVRGRGG